MSFAKTQSGTTMTAAVMGNAHFQLLSRFKLAVYMIISGVRGAERLLIDSGKSHTFCKRSCRE